MPFAGPERPLQATTVYADKESSSRGISALEQLLNAPYDISTTYTKTQSLRTKRVGMDAFVRPASAASAPDECVRGYVF